MAAFLALSSHVLGIFDQFLDVFLQVDLPLLDLLVKSTIYLVQLQHNIGVIVSLLGCLSTVSSDLGHPDSFLVFCCFGWLAHKTWQWFLRPVYRVSFFHSHLLRGIHLCKQVLADRLGRNFVGIFNVLSNEDRLVISHLDALRVLRVCMDLEFSQIFNLRFFSFVRCRLRLLLGTRVRARSVAY